MRNNYYLVGSSFLLLFSIIIFLKNPNKNLYNKSLCFLLFINMILSYLFWLNPIEKSLIHYYDGILAKISFLLFSIYTLFIKEIDTKTKINFILILLSTLFLFYNSNYYSIIKWCSNDHILCHFLFHILIMLGCLIALE